jgi:hypothetical protein
MRSCNFLRLIYNKVTLRSLNFHTLFFEKLIFPTISKIAKFGKKTQGILGVKYTI